MEERRRQIGELAKATGLTVRTLRHYDELGLLEPSERTEAGYRLYGEADVERLYRILALRRLGLGLEEIGSVLGDGGPDLPALVREHIGRVERELEGADRLRRRLLRILDALEQPSEPSVEHLLEAMEAMTMIEKHYTPDQLSELEERRHALGEEGMRQAERDWTELIAAVEAERERGADPAGPRMQELAARWRAQVEAFTGGDAGIERSLNGMYREEGVEQASRGMIDEGLMAYVGQAMAASKAG